MAGPRSPLLVESRALIDALGYVDTEYSSAEAQAQVQHQIRAEMGAFRPRAYLDEFLPAYQPTFGGSARLQTELRRVAAGVKLDAVDLSRYSVAAPTGKNAKSVEAWEKAVKQQRVAIEHESNQYVILLVLGFSSCFHGFMFSWTPVFMGSSFHVFMISWAHVFMFPWHHVFRSVVFFVFVRICCTNEWGIVW